LTDHWMMILGPLIVLVVLTARRGVYGYLLDWDGRRASAWRPAPGKGSQP
jgi:branched-chain amino acid transport system permease protein